MDWVHSGDSHLVHPDRLWMDTLTIAESMRMPRSQWLSPTEQEIRVDGKIFHRTMPEPEELSLTEDRLRPKGLSDLSHRLDDMTVEGVWAEVIYLSASTWIYQVEDQALLAKACAAINTWLAEEVVGAAPDRLVPAALLPIGDVERSLIALDHLIDLGLHLVEFPVRGAVMHGDLHDPCWDPLWRRAAEAGVVIGFHGMVESPEDAIDGPGGVVATYAMTHHAAQRVVAKLVGSGALDRHPDLKILISEAGAGWLPHFAETLEEGYLTQRPMVDIVYGRSPKDVVLEQVYVAFQHEPSTPAMCVAAGYENLLFGRDYPHAEGTWGETWEVLDDALAPLSAEDRERVLTGAFSQLFPHVQSVVAV